MRKLIFVIVSFAILAAITIWILFSPSPPPNARQMFFLKVNDAIADLKKEITKEIRDSPDQPRFTLDRSITEQRALEAKNRAEGVIQQLLVDPDGSIVISGSLHSEKTGGSSIIVRFSLKPTRNTAGEIDWKCFAETTDSLPTFCERVTSLK